VTLLLDDVIDAYARSGVAGVRHDGDFRAMAEEHGEDPDFRAMVSRVSAIAGELERTTRGVEARDQVISALELFNSHRNRSEGAAICGKLTRRRYAAKWSQSQRDYYERAIQKLEHWMDYFLSFTNYNPTAGEVMFVNNQHKRLINTGLGQTFRPPATREENLVARLLEYMLRNSPLHGYFYPKARDPQDVRARLQREARRCLAFVQLVQNSMFEKWPNYCHDEFEAAREDASRIMIFVITVPLSQFIKRANVENQMHGWHEAITKPDVVDLEPTDKIAQVRELLAKLETHVIGRVASARDDLIGNVPAA
jgi:hypothetical protein